MRIRKFSPNSSVSTTSPSSSSSSFHSSSITTHSITSSTDSSPLNFSSSSPSSSRCEGLNLLVKAIYHVSAGSVVGVPYIQRRVIRRRRRALRFNQLIVTQFKILKEEQVGVDREEKESGDEPNSMCKRQRRVMALPSKYQDSVLQPWRPRSRSNKIGDGSSQ